MYRPSGPAASSHSGRKWSGGHSSCSQFLLGATEVRVLTHSRGGGRRSRPPTSVGSKADRVQGSLGTGGPSPLDEDDASPVLTSDGASGELASQASPRGAAHGMHGHFWTAAVRGGLRFHSPQPAGCPRRLLPRGALQVRPAALRPAGAALSQCPHRASQSTVHPGTRVRTVITAASSCSGGNAAEPLNAVCGHFSLSFLF